MRADDSGHPMQMALPVGPTGRTISRRVLTDSGLSEELLCRLAFVGLLHPVAGTAGRQYDAERVSEMWRQVAHERGVAKPSLADVEAVVREAEARRG